MMQDDAWTSAATSGPRKSTGAKSHTRIGKGATTTLVGAHSGGRTWPEPMRSTLEKQSAGLPSEKK